MLASGLTLILVTSTGWLTTQDVVSKARDEGARQVASLRSGICLARFQQRPDSKVKLAEFKALSYSERRSAIVSFVNNEGIATMQGETTPSAGSVDKCTDAISSS